MSSSLFGSFGSSGAPGNLTPFDVGAAGGAAGLSLDAIKNRYNQLGLGGSTAENMDIGALPSDTSGLVGQYGALLGQMQTNALATAPGGSGKSSNPLSAVGNIGNFGK